MCLAKAVFALTAVALLGACAGPVYIDNKLRPIRDMAVSGPAFSKALHGEYLGLADKEYAAGDLSDTLFYADRASQAGKGAAVNVVDSLSQGMPKKKAEQWAGYELRLIRAFDNGAREKKPAVAARAQVAFDCAVREWCEVHDGIKDCTDRFLAALKQLEAKPPQPKPEPEPIARDYIIYFDYDKSSIRADAAQILDQVVAAVKKLRGALINLVGHTDTVGSRAYNQRLSQRRAAAAEKYLYGKGIRHGVRAKGVGETDPRVARGRDEYRAQENRRVEINLR